MARSVAALALLVLTLAACRSSHGGASAPYNVAHVRAVFAVHRLRFTVPRSFAVGYACTRLKGVRAFLDGSPWWTGMLFKDERSALQQDRCIARAGVGRAYMHFRRRNLVIVAKSTLRRQIRAALAAL